MGPWWMTVKKLEANLRELSKAVTATGTDHPTLAETPALTGAEAAVTRASAALRRANSPRQEAGDELLRKASDAVSRADQAVQRARHLADLANRARAPRRQD